MELSTSRPGLWKLFRIWAIIGLQSFGGGASTIFLIRRTFIEVYKWTTNEEMNRFWILCVFTPGINLVALCVLIGRKLGGTWGIVVSLIGFLVPSASITAILTALFVIIEHIQGVQAVLRGVVPATAGLMFLVAFRFLQPLANDIRYEGWFRIVASIVLVIVCFVAITFFNISVIVVVLGAAVIGALLFKPNKPQQPDTLHSIERSEQAALPNRRQPVPETGVLPND